MRIAREHGVSLYPVSQGRNWGYGDACPVGAGQVVLDLSAMNRIVEVDPDLAYAVIEPGVTQGQLAAHLRAMDGNLISSVTGGSADASVLGNLIERGFGFSPYGEHAANACGMEVVLADGTLLKTGMAGYEGSASAYSYRWGLGPSLDGLFTQSNLGIVVRAGVWLMPQPEDADDLQPRDRDGRGPGARDRPIPQAAPARDPDRRGLHRERVPHPCNHGPVPLARDRG